VPLRGFYEALPDAAALESNAHMGFAIVWNSEDISTMALRRFSPNEKRFSFPCVQFAKKTC